MQHQHIDEFSVTDIRHTLNEAWRIILARRWFLVFPFFIVSTIGCLCSLLIPRQYSISTVIKREHDPVFANMIRKAWTQPYDDIRKQMGRTIRDPGFIRGILKAKHLPDGLPRYDDGLLTPQGETVREALVSSIVDGLTTTTIEASPHRDIVKIRLKMDDPSAVSDLLASIRDTYMTEAREKTVQVLEKVQGFLRTESQRCQRERALLQQQFVELSLRYPGVNPESTDVLNAEQTTLVIERVQVERKLDELELEQGRLQTALAHAVGRDRENEPAAEPMVEEPNPRYEETLQEIKNLRQRIVEGRTLRSMTDEHPEIVGNRRRLAALEASLAKMPRILRVSAKVVGDPFAGLAAIKDLETRSAEAAVGITAQRQRLAGLRSRLEQLEGNRALALEHRPAYVKIERELARLEAEISDWRSDIAPIQHVLYLEDKDRSIHFTVLEDVKPVLKPSSPDALFVMMICFGIGLAAAVTTVLAAELLDRSYRTAKQLTSSLGIPVIESIDEILTKAVHRRRLLRRLVVTPSLAVLLATATVMAGTLAYLSLEHPLALGGTRALSSQLFGFLGEPGSTAGGEARG